MTSLRVGTWNVLADSCVSPELYPLSPAEFLVPSARVSAIKSTLVEIIKSLALDMMCLQEVDQPLLSELTTLARDSNWTLIASPAIGCGSEGCVTTICGDWRPAVSTHVGYQCLPGNLAQRFVLRNDGYRVNLCHTHVRWTGDVSTLYGQLDELAAWSGDDAATSIIIGDLNVRPGTPALQTMAAQGFRDVHDDHSLVTASFVETGPVRLDYILVRGGSGKPLSASAIKIAEGMALPGPANPSDHIPLAAEVGAM